MKLAFRQIDAFVASLPPNIRCVVVYGPDSGLIRERAQTIGKQVVADLADPFNVSGLTGDQIVSDPARLSDEAFAQSLMGGRRLVRIDDAGDKLTPHLKAYLARPNDQTLVLVLAGELGPKSSLRALAEKAENAAALPCYLDSAEDVANLVAQALRASGYKMDADASVLFSQAITGDRMQVRAEIEKLKTYMGADKHVKLADVEACVGAGGLATLDELADSFMMNQHAVFLMSLRRLLADGTAPIYVLRSLQGHLRRLHLVKSQIASGKAEEMAMKGLHPPVFFKREKAFQWQLKNNTLPQLEQKIAALLQIEAAAKSGTLDDTLQTAHNLLRTMKQAA